LGLTKFLFLSLSLFASPSSTVDGLDARDAARDQRFFGETSFPKLL
jgi:hypothetical protein